jgi:metallo-beta-lactamase family protein
MPTHTPRGACKPTVTFLGAARSVTGSMHLVEVGDERILLDCGLTRGENGPVRSPSFPFDPATIDAVVLSHAHMDHCGNLPSLVRQGFDGPIYCTPATRELVAVMLADNARIQEEEAYILSVVGGPDVEPAPPLPPRSYAHQALRQCVPVEYGRAVAVSANVQLRFADAGHILGSAMAQLTLAGPGRDVTMTFTGDVGRRGLPYLHDAAPVPPCDLLVSESTYGGRFHQTREEITERLSAVVTRSADEGGAVLIPAFSLGRTQLVVHYLSRGMDEGWLPSLPVFVDSPLAADVADVYARYPRHFADPPGDGDVEYVRLREESDELAERRGPFVLVASGGMCDGGRIIKHLRRHVDDPRASLLLVSYQAPGSVGRRLLELAPKVRFHGRSWNKWIEVVELNGFSGHADHADLLAYCEPLIERTERVRLVHGEPEGALALADALADRGFPDVDAPARGETVEVG